MFDKFDNPTGRAIAHFIYRPIEKIPLSRLTSNNSDIIAFTKSDNKEKINVIIKLLDIPYYDGKLVQFLLLNGTYDPEEMTIKFNRYNTTAFYSEDLTTTLAPECQIDVAFKFDILNKGVNSLSNSRQIKSKSIKNDGNFEDFDSKNVMGLTSIKMPLTLNETNSQMPFSIKSQNDKCNIDVEGVLEFTYNDKKSKIMDYCIFGFTTLIINLFSVVHFVNKILEKNELAHSVIFQFLINLGQLNLFDNNGNNRHIFMLCSLVLRLQILTNIFCVVFTDILAFPDVFSIRLKNAEHHSKNTNNHFRKLRCTPIHKIFINKKSIGY